tara:strand:- start:62 stop:235 length:174 start_codon:yes stop_codon:yes gene_type:complete
MRPAKDNFETPINLFFLSALNLIISQFLAKQADKANQESLLDNIFSNWLEQNEEKFP